MRTVKSCGVVLFARNPRARFLLMKHVDRWDLPKGHVDRGETELECALREFEEETGIDRGRIELDPVFRFAETYYPLDRGGVSLVEKTLVMFLAWVEEPVSVAPTEHLGYEWFDWAPPHAIQSRTIDPLLASVANHLEVARGTVVD